MITFTFHRHVCLAEKNTTPRSIGHRATILGLNKILRPASLLPHHSGETPLKKALMQNKAIRYGQIKVMPLRPS
jgi:hypothetical protein